ncbi:MAG TPA: 50S ribosomal protein L5 [Candidatus Nanoarchaeia archaeon]|nr:50S ribosomal protein L5 [Candidatus Nanoarchaeia archaeon]
MRSIRIEKVTLNIGAGKDPKVLEKGLKVLKSVTGIAPVKIVTQKRIPTWGLRPGLPIGCKVTIRGKAGETLLRRLLDARSFTLTESQFDDHGNVSFGIPEYIDIPGVKYDPDIGIMGLQVCITLERPGFRVKRRRVRRAPIAARHMIRKQDAMGFLQQSFDVKIGESG